MAVVIEKSRDLFVDQICHIDTIFENNRYGHTAKAAVVFDHQYIKDFTNDLSFCYARGALMIYPNIPPMARL